MFLNKNLL